MWTFDYASQLDMDSRRACPSYGVGFDACDPLGSVLEWSGRGAAKIVRRRCRSEGVDRSPYEHAIRDRSAEGRERLRTLPKSYFTLNYTEERFHHECTLPVAQNGDYVMDNEQNRLQGYQPERSKMYRKSPTRPLLVTTLSNTKVEDISNQSRLPKVEELLEKFDHEMMEMPLKQPLKSILNNTIPKSPPQGILKKPKNKNYQESKTVEGRRRQRASSESDNLYCNFHMGSPIPGYEGHISYQSNNTKRAKDNSGTCYSYGSAIASLGAAPRSKSPSYKSRSTYKSPTREQSLRTTAITNDMAGEPGSDTSTPTPTCPVVSPALPVSSVTAVPVVKKQSKTTKKKTKPKSKKMKSTTKLECGVVDETEDAHSRSPSPDTSEWHMETDIPLMEEKPPPPAPAPSPHAPTSLPHAPTSLPHAPTSLPHAHTSLPHAPTSLPHAPTSLPHAPTSLPHAPASVPHAPASMPHAPTLPRAPTSLPHAPTSLPHAPSSLPHAPATAPHSLIVVHKEDEAGTKLTSKLNGTAVKKPSKESPLNLPESISNCLRASLFPRVPPYLKFVSYEETMPLKIPPAIQKHLKWKLTTITPIVVQKTLTNSGFRLVKSECDTAECPQEETVEWIGIWGKHMKSLMFRAIKDGQKMNHFPGTFQIGRKDRLWRNLQKLANKYGVDEFGIMPKTYVLPHDMKQLKHDWQKYAANNEKWIIKPPASARGTGIKVVSRWTQIPKKRPVVVQRYISKPYLINGSKFDMRLYVLVTSVHPLRIYLYKDGLARFASVKYNDDLNTLNDRYMHLTNYSINRLSKNYTPNEDFNACEGHKWTLQTLFQYLKTEKNVDTDSLWDSMKDLVIKTIISGEASISALTKANITSRYNCYELFGIDVLLDEDLKPWLLEVNISPSLHSASPLDKHVKGPLVCTTLNIAQFQVPVRTNLDMLSKDKPHKLAGLPYDSRLYTVYLSKEERDKHIIYTNMEDRDMYLRDILSTLTPDDVRHLVQAEDELCAARELQRVFPTAASHSYLPYLAGPRYYNRLFDAWEARYGDNRGAGIELLRNLCEIGYHLEVPPVPLKNDVDAPSPPPSARPSAVSLETTASAQSQS